MSSRTVLILGLAAVITRNAGAPVVYGQELSPRPPLITVETEDAIQRGTTWLIKNQNTDGIWSSNGLDGNYPGTMTALAGLALLAAGNTPHQGPHAAAVRRAVDAVLRLAGPAGLIASPTESRTLYSHGFAMLFLAQAYGMEFDPVRQDKIRRVLEQAVELTAASQSAAGGWYYSPDSDRDEGSVTVTQIQALRAARNAGIKVPKQTITRAGQYIEKSANPDGGIRYMASQSPGTPSRPAITAAAVATLYNAGQYENPVALKALEHLKKLLAGKDGDQVLADHYYYAMLYASQAMYLSGEENWTRYFPGWRDRLLKLQTPTGAWIGDSVGTVYGTSLALLVLQLPYGYLPILQR